MPTRKKTAREASRKADTKQAMGKWEKRKAGKRGKEESGKKERRKAGKGGKEPNKRAQKKEKAPGLNRRTEKQW